MAEPLSSASLPGMEPLQVTVTRGSELESVHTCHLVACAANQQIAASCGDPNFAIFPRSAIKMMQALAFVSSGAADQFNCSQQELALACASHKGEPMHRNQIANWLARIRLSAENLACGTHPPVSKTAFAEMVAAREPFSPLCNNCSGKHTAMLTLAKQQGWPISDYHLPEHPVQQLLAKTIGQLCDYDLSKCPYERDGCSVPTWKIPMAHISLGISRFAIAQTQPLHHAAAMRRLWQAMVSYPELVAGSNAFDSKIIRAAAGEIICKSGAEGVCVLAHRGYGWGFAIKCLDGSARAGEAIVLSLIQHLNLLGENTQHNLPDRRIKTVRGDPVGEVAVKFEQNLLEQLQIMTRN